MRIYPDTTILDVPLINLGRVGIKWITIGQSSRLTNLISWLMSTATVSN